ncbi:MAG: folA [Gammaproteobacteria bacterium]|jgi:dihydrofolate reductase|nr:folA [Gammaproteobacteria bacterium]
MKNISGKFSIIVAIADQGVIGYKNATPWHMPKDLRRFRQLTIGKPIVMGRKTYESIGHALPGRTNIIMTTQKNFIAEECLIAHSFDQAIELAVSSNMYQEVQEIMIIGGASIYEQFLPRCENFYLTVIHNKFLGDTFFPAWDRRQWQVIACEAHEADNENPYAYEFIDMKRITQAINSAEALKNC